MALQDYYNTNDDNTYAFFGVNWAAQTWKAGSSYDASSVKVKLYRAGTPGDLTLGLYATTDGKPSGGALVSKVQSGNGITTDTAGEWIEFAFASSYGVTSGTTYAIVISGGTNVSNRCTWRSDNSSPTYADGNGCYSTNSGSTWNSSTNDCMFEIYGLSTTYSELSGTIAGVGAMSGNLSSYSMSELSGTIAGVGAMSGNLGSVLVHISSDINYKRLVVVGSNGFYYEDI